MSDPQQDGTGHYHPSSLHSGASPEEQSRYGGQSYHQPWEVDNLVNQGRLREIGQRYANAGNSGQPITMPTAAGAGSGSAAGFFKFLATIVLLVAGATGFAFVYASYESRVVNESYYRPREVWIPSLAQAIRLYQPGTKLKADWAGLVRWPALRNLRGRALHPERYDNDLCTAADSKMSLPADMPADLRATWKITPNGFCQAENSAALIERARANNWRQAVLALVEGLVVGCAVLGLLIATWRAKRTSA